MNLSRLFITTLIGIGIALGIYGCGNKGSSSTNYDSPKTYFSTMTDLTIEVAYEPGAEPYIGTVSTLAPAPFKGRNYWDLTSENLKALFQGRTTAVTVTVPTTLAEMTALPAQNQTSWTTTMLSNLATQYRANASTSTHGYLFLVFVKGYLSSGGVQQTNVIGVNIAGTPITAIFKDVVTSTGSTTSRVPKYVEQSTIVHELGHALGLVNSGLSMVSSHQDTANGAHCNNTNCVMYYLNEGKSDMVAYVVTAETSGSLVIYDSQCLEDARNYKP